MFTDSPELICIFEKNKFSILRPPSKIERFFLKYVLTKCLTFFLFLSHSNFFLFLFFLYLNLKYKLNDEGINQEFRERPKRCRFKKQSIRSERSLRVKFNELENIPPKSSRGMKEGIELMNISIRGKKLVTL